jgi:hypothetical protein
VIVSRSEDLTAKATGVAFTLQEYQRLQRFILQMAERIAAQSELLSRRAEGRSPPPVFQTIDCEADE